MNNSDFKEAAERYKKEMIDLYGAKSNQDTISEHVKEEEDNKEEENKKEIKDNQKNDADELTEDKIDERFPPPVIPDFIKNPQSDIQNDSFGYLKVSVRTGNGGIPIEGSAVTVSQTVDGKESIVRMLSTDSSGDTETIKLPAPKKPSGNEPQDYEHYTTYNISAFSEGYFREVSENAPIFEGITSIQTFLLIPLPYNYDQDKNSIDYNNIEPDV